MSLKELGHLPLDQRLVHQEEVEDKLKRQPWRQLKRQLKRQPWKQPLKLKQPLSLQKRQLQQR